MRFIFQRAILWMGLFALLLVGCADRHRQPSVFEVLKSERTGLRFANRLNSTDSFNLFKYMYFYNGAGIGAGDFNNDGMVDLFFASNQGNNSLFLNKGNLQFEDVTAKTNIPADHAWSTGVSVVDINNDGLLDMYISRVGKYKILNGKNQFLICQGIDSSGIPTYRDMAQEYGLDFSGFGTQAAFLDIDLDGDLDIFLLNHSVHENGNFRAREEFMGTYHPTTGSRLFRNDSTVFVDITKESGINSSAIGYGLGIAISDINLDGYPDIYVGNDFHENDYLYINQKNGTFADLASTQLMHTSQFTMGVDVADANNDGFPEVISMDMLPSDPYILKRSLSEDDYDVFNMKISFGYNYQYTRNNLQYNRKNGHFSETGLYSGVSATDWSWSPLWVDFDNDGLKDLFISNGIPKRMNDIDYINYVSDQEIQQKIRDNKTEEKNQMLINKFPQIRIPNKFFNNKGQLQFQDLQDQIGNNISTYSNGAVYADLDNDGDLDIIVNNIDEDAVIYQNMVNDGKNQSYLQLSLLGSENNINAVGAKVILYTGTEIRTYEKFPVKGFLSSMEIPMHIGLDSTKVDSAFLVWPDNTYQVLTFQDLPNVLEAKYKKDLPAFDYSRIFQKNNRTADPAEEITKKVGLHYLHTENNFTEFDREPLIPHMFSTEGPALAVADINHDGLEDVFAGGSRNKKSAVFLQTAAGVFAETEQPSLASDSSYEDVDATWADVNNDTFIDLVVASGGNEYYGNDPHLMPRVYLNDGKGNLTRKKDAFSFIYSNASTVTADDFNGDGFTDLFIGGRTVPGQYGKPPPSYLLQNDGTGKFMNVTGQYSRSLQDAGFVTKAVWYDIDNDKDKDLLLCSEWGTIDAYINNKGSLDKKVLFDKKGWWNFILPCDINGDGQTDLIAGNLGLNSKLQASDQQPVKLYYNDFDDNDKKEPVLTYFLQGKEIPFANKMDLERVMPMLRKKFLFAKDFASASLSEMFGSSKLENADQLQANYFSNCVLINKGNMVFEAAVLPWQMQLSAFRDAAVVHANSDSLPDILMLGNYYGNNTEMGRSDADFGSLLINDGKGGFRYEELNGLTIKGQARAVRKISINSKEAYVIARNNDSAMVVQFVPK